MMKVNRFLVNAIKIGLTFYGSSSPKYNDNYSNKNIKAKDAPKETKKPISNP